MNKREIGEALDRLDAEARDVVLDLTAQYRKHRLPDLLKQAIDTPRRARAQLAAWIASYNQRKGAGAGVPFLASCLTAAAATRTVAQIDAALAALESQALVIVGRVTNERPPWDDVAAAIEQAIAQPSDETFSYKLLPIPTDYVTVWNEPWIKPKSGDKSASEDAAHAVL